MGTGLVQEISNTICSTFTTCWDKNCKAEKVEDLQVMPATIFWSRMLTAAGTLEDCLAYSGCLAADQSSAQHCTGNISVQPVSLTTYCRSD